MRIAIAGIGGRMGRDVAAAAATQPGIVVVGGLTRPGADNPQPPPGAGPVFTDPADLLDRVDVLIDFTRPSATVGLAEACVAAGRPLVCGTTGLDSAQMAALRAAAGTIPVFYARNLSVGIAALLAALPALVRALDGYDIEIVETHHRHKTDAPSGTAVALAETIAAARSASLAAIATHGRHGEAPRQPGEIGIHAVRAGGNTGEHTVLIANDGEEIRLHHRAHSRQTFALGALRAARFLAAQRPGWYGMPDLLAAPPA